MLHLIWAGISARYPYIYEGPTVLHFCNGGVSLVRAFYVETWAKSSCFSVDQCSEVFTI